MTTQPSTQLRDVKISGTTLVLFIVLFAALLGMVALRSQPPAPLGTDAPADTFSAGRAMARLEALLAEGVPHPVGSAADAVIRERIVDQLAQLGLEAEVQQGVACSERGTCAPVSNVVSRLPGSGDGPAVLLACHYDSVAAGPGAADDISAVAVLLVVARILRAEPVRRNPVVLLFNEGEEAGLLGARAFMAQYPEPAAAFAAVLNVEARGTGGLSVMFETSDKSAWLIEMYAQHVVRPTAASLSQEVYRRMPNDTDLSIFMEHGIEGMNFAFIGRPLHYHTPLDSPASLEWGSVQHHGDCVLAMTRALAEADLGAPRPASEAVYADLLGLVLLRWPAGFTLPLALLALLLLVTAAVGALRRRLTGPRQLAMGLVAFAAILVVSAAAGWGLTSLVAAVTGLANPWPAYPLPSRVAMWAAVAAIATGVAWLMRRRTDCWGMSLAGWTCWAVVGALLAAPVAGVAVIFIAPALLAALLLAVSAWASTRLLVPVIILASLYAGSLWLPMVLLCELSFGFALSAVLALTLALVAATFSPLFAAAEGHPGRGVVVLGLAIFAGVAFVVACLLPPHSAWAPRRLNILHFEDADAGEASWVVYRPVTEVPAAVVAAGELVIRSQSSIFPWSDSEDECAAGPAPRTGDPPPVLEPMATLATEESRSVDLLLRSPRGARSAWLMFPADSVLAAMVADQPVTPRPFGDELELLQVLGLPPEGLRIHLELAGIEAVQIILTDRRDTLPAAAQPLLAARPDSYVPRHSGDVSLLVTRTTL